ncbi:MAG: DUF4402 domain-containing protein [Pseudomonadota bacterium]|nr:DUF4402 domain-containing protein [Pseudomonadota bacterium]
MMLSCPVRTVRLLAALLLLSAAAAFAANKIGVVTNTGNLSFGRFVANTGGTIVLNTAGQRAATGGVVLLSGISVTAASYTLTEIGTGKALAFTTISLPGSATLSNGSATMTVNNFVSDPPNTVVGSGKTTVLVGATLRVAPLQAGGNYSGTYAITVNYQ